MAIYLTTTPQVIGENESYDIHAYLYGWYSNQSGNTCTVHVRLTLISTTQTYAEASKTYMLVLGGYNSGTQSWSYSPIETDVEYTVAETTWTYADGDSIDSEATLWVQGIGSIVVNLADTTYVSFATPPTDLSVTLNYATAYGANLTASISSYGNYTGTPNKYIAVGVFDQNTWRNPSSSDNYAADSLSNTFNIENVDSSSGSSSPLVPNTLYYYGGAANNGEESVTQMFGQFVTPVYSVYAIFVSRTGTSANIEYELEEDGGYYTKTLQYNIDRSENWTTFATVSSGDPIDWAPMTINNISSGSHLIEFRVLTPAGASSSVPQVFLPSMTNKLYGSDGSERVFVDKIYGSVDDTTPTLYRLRRINKLYGSVNNQAKLIHQGFGHVNYN